MASDRPDPGHLSIPIRKRIHEALCHGNWNPKRSVDYLPAKPKKLRVWKRLFR